MELNRSKGFIISSSVLIVMFIIASVVMLGIIGFVLFLKVHIYNIAQYEYSYNNAQLALMALLSSTYDGERVSNLIGECYAAGDCSDIKQVLEQKLEALVESKCYKLSISSTVLASADCEPTQYVSTARIALPYKSGSSSSSVEVLKLVND